MKIKDIMQRNVITVSPETGIKEIFKLMVNRKITCLPVMDKEQNIVGIITESHLLMRGREIDKMKGKSNHADYKGFIEEQKRLYGKTAKDIMVKPALTVDENDDLIDVINKMLEKKVRRFPVMRRNKLVGFVSRSDIIKAIMDIEDHKEKHMENELSDEEIVKRISSAFKEHLGMQILNVRVSCTRGQVRLTGQVGSNEDHQAAEEIAGSIPYVRSVENNLVIDALLK